MDQEITVVLNITIENRTGSIDDKECRIDQSRTLTVGNIAVEDQIDTCGVVTHYCEGGSVGVAYILEGGTGGTVIHKNLGNSSRSSSRLTVKRP